MALINVVQNVIFIHKIGVGALRTPVLALKMDFWGLGEGVSCCSQRGCCIFPPDGQSACRFQRVNI